MLVVVACLACFAQGVPQLDFDRFNNFNQIQRPDNQRNQQRISGLPSYDPYQPEKSAEIPIVLGERRCDNIYHGTILPCLLRPDLPPYSYSTTEDYNMEYKK